MSHPGFLAAFLGSPFGQHQLQARIYGGVVDELTAEDTAEVLVSEVPFPAPEEIGQLVTRAFETGDLANDLEDQAIREFELRCSRQVLDVK